MILKFFAVIMAIMTIVCLLLAQAGDNSDAKALAGIFYFPAIFFGVTDIVLWIVIFI